MDGIPFDYGKQTEAEETAFMNLYAAVTVTQEAATRMYSLMGRLVCLRKDDPDSPYVPELISSLETAQTEHRLARAELENARRIYNYEVLHRNDI